MKRILFAIFALLWSALLIAGVDINTATKAQLDSVKGIGPVKAQAIIDHRRKHGPFKSIDELKDVKGFGDKSVAEIKKGGELSLGGGTKAEARKDAPKAAAKPAEKSDKK